MPARVPAEKAQSNKMLTTPDQFYTGLISELYEPLAGGLPETEPYEQFIARYGQPALELGCGSGLPMLDLLKGGYEVEGLDASADMLAICQKKAQALGFDPVLHHGLFQSFDLGKTYRSIYIASASFTLLTNDDDALAALRAIHKHLLPGGALFLPLEIPDIDEVPLNQFKKSTDDAGNVIRVGAVAADQSEDGRNVEITLRYEKQQLNGEVETVDRVWHRRGWSEAQITELFSEAGFQNLKILPKNEPPPRPFFTVIAEV